MHEKAQKYVRRAMELTEDIRTELDLGGRVLWDCFLAHDRELNGVIECEEMGGLVRDLFQTNERRFITAILDDIDAEIYGEDTGLEGTDATFVEVYEWFGGLRRNLLGAVFELQLKGRSVFNSLKSLISEPVYERYLQRSLEHHGVGCLEKAITGLEKTYYDVKVLQAHSRSQRLEDIENHKLRIYPHRKWFPEKRRAHLYIMFTQLLAVECKTTLTTAVDIPKAAALLGYNLSYEEHVVTKICHEEEMDFEGFIRWWACRSAIRIRF
eukprot:TRINITY_DN19960_c0_g1_i1.p1 TRINITY_DN19960_c0_g1~~TRINITY_DN19960_c0_g1_i1.p1  ORF type:complete len:268 (+),score=36.10 TRINITY_DN19960_c0_g1_i1:92-895(+)